MSPISRHFNAAPEGLGPEQVRSYLLHLVQERHVSWSYYNRARCPLRFFYRVTLGKDWVVQEVACPKVPKRLPVVLSPDELVRFFKGVNNLKHRAILMTTYAVGLRLSEVSRLQVEDVDSSRMVIHGMRPREPGVNCRILPIFPVLVEMAINRSGSHRQISVKFTALC